MSSRTVALARAFVVRFSRVPVVVLTAMAAQAGLGSTALGAGMDYATCFSDGKVGADQQIAACTPIAEDSSEIPDLRVNAYFWRGLAYTQKNDIDHVIADMNEVIALDPTYVRAFTNRAIAWESKGDFDRAVADYTGAIALTPNDANLYAYRARALGKGGEHDRAIAECDKAIDIDPANEIAYGVRGVQWEDKGDAARSQADYDKAESVRTDPVAPYQDRVRSWIAKGERKRAEADCKYIAGVDVSKGRACSHLIVKALGDPRDGGPGSNPASAQNAIGVGWQEKGDHTRAIAAFDEAIRLNPTSSAFYFNRAKSWGLKKNYTRALTDLNEAVRRNPANAEAYRVRGMTMARIGNSKEAFADLDKAISISADDPKPYFERALVWETSDPNKALADLDKAIALDPANVGYRNERLRVQLDKRRAKGQPVLQAPDTEDNQGPETADTSNPAAMQAAKPAEPPTYEPFQPYPKKVDHSEIVASTLKRGLEQQARGNLNDAIDSFNFAIERDPYNADAFYNRSIAEASRGNDAVAAKDCRRAVDLDPRRTGSCNDHASAEPAESAAGGTRNPAAAKVLIERAKARLAEYSADSALIDLATAIRLDPDNAEAYLREGERGRRTGTRPEHRRIAVTRSNSIRNGQELATSRLQAAKACS